MLLEGTLILDQKNDTLLYAGAAKVNITDWFFFKDDVTLKYIGLDDATIYANRKDSVWNYQFLVDYFSGPPKKKNIDSAKNAIRLDLKVIELNRVKVFQKDEWTGKNMLVSFDKMNVDAEDLDLNGNAFKINTLTLDRPSFAQYEYKGLKPKRSKALRDSLLSQPNLPPKGDEVLLSIKEIRINDGNFVLDKITERPAYIDRFDDKHMVLSSVNGILKNVRLAGETLTAAIKLSAKDRSGFELKKLEAAFKFTPAIMEFKDLDLITNRSHLKNYYAMRYNDFNDDMSDFMHAVNLEGNFAGSELSSDDIAFFAPQVKTWNKNFSLTGNVKGTIDNLIGKDLSIRSGADYFNGTASLRGLPVANDIYIDLTANDLRTSYSQLASFIPDIKSVQNPKLSALGNIHFVGKYTGFLRDFVMYGTVDTDLGTLVTDLNMKLPENSVPVYSGKISTGNFQLGNFIANSQVGNISFNGKVNGKGFNAKDINLLIDGTINRIQFNNYNFQNIVAKGNFRNNLFEGAGSIDDPNLRVDGLIGSINFSAKNPRFNLDADVSKMNLKELGFTLGTFSLTGKFNLNFSGDNIDNFLGTARIYNATLRNIERNLSFDSLTITSNYLNDKKYLSVQTNELEANVAGNFKIAELPEAFQSFLNRYYPAYIKKPKNAIHAQDFSFYIKTKDVSDYISLLDKNLKGFNSSEISGDIDLARNSLNVKVQTPGFSYKTINFNDLNFIGKGTYDTLFLVGDVRDVVINDSLHLPDTKILVTANNDISDVVIKTSASKTLNEADLSARVQTLTDGFKLYFNPSSFVINDKKWKLEKGGELVLSKKMLTASEVKFVQEQQELTISTEPSSTGSSTDILIDLKKINIGDFTPFLIKSLRLEGLITGNIKIEDPFGRMMMEFNTKTDQFRFENDSMGVLQTSGHYSSVSGDLFIKAISDNEFYNFLADVTYRTKDSTGNQLAGKMDLKRANIHILQKYLNGIFSGIHGNATGQLNISGQAKDPKITGKINLNDAGLTVDYTRARYLFNENSTVAFEKDYIDFGTLKIKDTLNNTATVSGRLYHTFFDDFFFNELQMKTDRKNGKPGKFVLLNTSSKDNKEFYGNVIGDAQLSLNGPVTDMRMEIRAEPTDSSHIYLPTGETAETGKINYIEFIKFGREMQADLSSKEEANMKVNMELTANPYAKIDVILDDITGDVIKAQGSGKLNISAGTKDPLLIRGRYDVEQGQYTFNFQTFLKTPFRLKEGYIEWQGDPYLANLNIDATYRAEKVDLSSIVTSSGASSTKGDVDILFKLRGTLKEPRTNFEFQFPFDNPLRSDPIASEYLKTKYQSDQNEMNKQVTSLLLFNTFMPESQRLFTRNNTGNFVTRTLGQVLSSTLSSSLNNWLQKLLKTDAVNLYTNINTSDFNFEGSNQQQQLQKIQNLGNFGLKTAFLNNRLLVNLGGNVDYRLIQSSSNSNTNFLFTPDVSFEWLITPDGRFRVVGFNRSDASLGDITGLTRRNRTGILLSFRKDFNTFSEFWKKKAAK